MGDHTVTLDDHDKKLKTHTHQLGLAKTAMDGEENVHGTGLGFGYHSVKGKDADKLIDWDCDLDAEGEPVLGDDGYPKGQRDVCRQCPAKRARDRCPGHRPSEQAPARRRLARRPKS